MTAGEYSLLLGGTDLETLVDCVEGPVVWPYQGSPQRGELPTFLNHDGTGFSTQPYESGVLPVQISIRPDCNVADEWGFALQASLDAVRLACKPDQALVLSKSGNSEIYTTRAKFLNITPEREVAPVLRCLLEFLLLDPLWYGTEETPGDITTSPAVFAVPGTTRTHRIVVTIDGSVASPTITNSTNGYSFTYTGTTAAGGVEVDVEARTATNITGGADVSRFLSWSKAHLFRLEPGNNTLVSSAGAADLAYYPAYL